MPENEKNKESEELTRLKANVKNFLELVTRYKSVEDPPGSGWYKLTLNSNDYLVQSAVAFDNFYSEYDLAVSVEALNVNDYQISWNPTLLRDFLAK